MDRAVFEFAERRFEESRSLFARAHALFPNARTYRGLGLAEFELRNYVACIKRLEAALESQVRPLDETLRADSEQLLKQAYDFVARFTLDTTPDVTRVKVDGFGVDTKNHQVLLLDIGEHVVELEATGFRSERRTLKVVGGESETLSVVFGAEQKTSSSEARILQPGGLVTGALRVESAAPGEVRVDGAVVGKAPVELHELNAGGHLVRIDYDEGSSAYQRVYVQAGQMTRVNFELPPLLSSGRSRRGVHFLLGGGPYFHSMTSGSKFGGGFQMLAGMNVGLGARADFRLVALLNAGTFGTEFQGGTMRGFELGGRPSFRLNFGSSYAMELGLRLGLYFDRHKQYDSYVFQQGPTRTRTAFEVGPELSLLSLRLGKQKQVELTLWHGVLFNFADYVHIQTGITVSYLFL